MTHWQHLADNSAIHSPTTNSTPSLPLAAMTCSDIITRWPMPKPVPQ